MLGRLARRAGIPIMLFAMVTWIENWLKTPEVVPLFGGPPSDFLLESLASVEQVLFWLVIAAVVSVFVLDEVFKDTVNPAWKTALESCFSGIREAMEHQMERASHALSAAVRAKMSDSTKHEIIEGFQDPEARDAAVQGNYETTKSLLEQNAKKDPAMHEQWIFSLILSDKRDDWERAWAELQSVTFPRPYMTLAFRYWSIGELDRAIHITSTGISKVAGVKDGKELESTVAKLKNSLAYYLADKADPKDEGDARRLAEESNQILPGSHTVSTLGYVQITYGKTEEEVKEGITLCENARQNGSDEDLYFRHLARAEQRLKLLRTRPRTAPTN